MVCEGEYISVPPTCYSDWLHAFEILQKRSIDKDELLCLKKGTCFDFADTAPFFETQLIKAVNQIIKKNISVFQKDLETYQIFNDFASIDRPFISFAKRMDNCVFFQDLDFLRAAFREELFQSVVQEVSRFWNALIHSLYLQCVDGNEMLEDQVLMIRRIKLFPNHNRS